MSVDRVIDATRAAARHLSTAHTTLTGSPTALTLHSLPEIAESLRQCAAWTEFTAFILDKRAKKAARVEDYPEPLREAAQTLAGHFHAAGVHAHNGWHQLSHVEDLACQIRRAAPGAPTRTSASIRFHHAVYTAGQQLFTAETILSGTEAGFPGSAYGYGPPPTFDVAALARFTTALDEAVTGLSLTVGDLRDWATRAADTEDYPEPLRAALQALAEDARDAAQHASATARALHRTQAVLADLTATPVQFGR